MPSIIDTNRSIVSTLDSAIESVKKQIKFFKPIGNVITYY